MRDRREPLGVPSNLIWVLGDEVPGDTVYNQVPRSEGGCAAERLDRFRGQASFSFEMFQALARRRFGLHYFFRSARPTSTNTCTGAQKQALSDGVCLCVSCVIVSVLRSVKVGHVALCIYPHGGTYDQRSYVHFAIVRCEKGRRS